MRQNAFCFKNSDCQISSFVYFRYISSYVRFAGFLTEREEADVRPRRQKPRRFDAKATGSRGLLIQRTLPKSAKSFDTSKSAAGLARSIHKLSVVGEGFPEEVVCGCPNECSSDNAKAEGLRAGRRLPSAR